MSSFLINNRTLPAINWSQMSWEFMHFLWGEMKDRQPETRKKMKTRRWNTLKRAKMEKCPSLASLKTAGNKQKSQQYQRIPEEATWLLSNIDRNVVNVRWLHLRLIRIKICSRVIATQHLSLCQVLLFSFTDHYKSLNATMLWWTNKCFNKSEAKWVVKAKWPGKGAISGACNPKWSQSGLVIVKEWILEALCSGKRSNHSAGKYPCT